MSTMPSYNRTERIALNQIVIRLTFGLFLRIFGFTVLFVFLSGTVSAIIQRGPNHGAPGWLSLVAFGVELVIAWTTLQVCLRHRLTVARPKGRLVLKDPAMPLQPAMRRWMLWYAGVKVVAIIAIAVIPIELSLKNLAVVISMATSMAASTDLVYGLLRQGYATLETTSA
jgi:hypothetical protein